MTAIFMFVSFLDLGCEVARDQPSLAKTGQPPRL